MAMMSMARNSKGTARHGLAWKWQGTAVQSKGYEVNCCAVARRREGMAEKSADVICEGKAVHRNDSLRQGFASDALAWQRDTLRRQSKEKAFY
jgi:hypothetical protein